MADGPDLSTNVRRAEISDREALLDVINHSFTRPGQPLKDFWAMYPYLFHDARIPDHFIYLEEGRILGAIGVYPFEVKIGGVSFRGAGIGQVSTLPECRGRGVMSAILNAAVAEMDKEGFDFTWLGGDRKRYGHFGWANGGETMRFTFTERSLPAPVAVNRLRPMDAALVRETLKSHRQELPDTVALPEFELEMLIETRKPGGCFLEDSFVVHNTAGNQVLFADGQPDQIALLISGMLQKLREKDADAREITAACPPAPSSLMHACWKHYRGLRRQTSAMYRVGELRPFLEKACRVAQPGVSAGSGRLELVNSDSGESATVTCQDGKLAVAGGAGPDAYRLNTTELSEVCFGPCPLDLLLPELPLDSPLRGVLPVPAHHDWFVSF